MHGDSSRLGRPFRILSGLALVGLCFAVGASLRDPAPRLAAVPVEHAETVLPACAPSETGIRRLTVLTAYLPRATADSVTAIRVAADGTTRAWRRAGGTCLAEGGLSEPCPVEACREGTCALRLALPEAAGPLDVTMTGPDGGTVAAGRALPPRAAPPAMPPLSAHRSGREVRLAGEPDAMVRVSALRDGRVAADVPTRLGGDGAARFAVPSGTEALRASVSRGGEEGVAQASLLLPGPFEGGCP